MMDLAGARHRTNVQKDVNVRLKDRSKHIKEPAVQVDLLLVFSPSGKR
jgi:hypothetical protein